MESQEEKYKHNVWEIYRKAPFIILGLALVASIVYCVVITGDRNALNTELESVKGVLASTQSELASTQSELDSVIDDLTSVRNEVDSLNNTIVSVQNELEATKSKLETTEAKLKLYEETLGVKVYSGMSPPYEKAGLGMSREINLNNNPIASNPTWRELKAFLLADPTDDEYYQKNLFNCVNFAEMLHNNAEAAGIKAAFVAVHFRDSDEGHALNVFKTTDKGLVYVDCTGGELTVPTLIFEERLRELIHPEERDKIASVVKGEEYGLISLGKNVPLDYDSYEKIEADWDYYLQKVEAYYKEVEEFNDEIFGKVYYIGTPEWERIKEWERTLEEQEEALDSMRAQLEYVWEEEMGIVESIEIYW